LVKTKREKKTYEHTFLNVLFNARVNLWPTNIGVFIFFSLYLSLWSIRFEDSMGIKMKKKMNKNQMFIFAHKHTCQKEWFHWFISIHTLMRCVYHSHQYTHTRRLIDILAGTYSLTSCFFLCRLSNDDDVDGHWTKKINEWPWWPTHTHSTQVSTREHRMIDEPSQTFTDMSGLCMLAGYRHN